MKNKTVYISNSDNSLLCRAVLKINENDEVVDYELTLYSGAYIDGIKCPKQLETRFLKAISGSKDGYDVISANEFAKLVGNL